MACQGFDDAATASHLGFSRCRPAAPAASHREWRLDFLGQHCRVILLEAVEHGGRAAGVPGDPDVQPLPRQPVVEHVHAHLQRQGTALSRCRDAYRRQVISVSCWESESMSASCFPSALPCAPAGRQRQRQPGLGGRGQKGCPGTCPSCACPPVGTSRDWRTESSTAQTICKAVHCETVGSKLRRGPRSGLMVRHVARPDAWSIVGPGGAGAGPGIQSGLGFKVSLATPSVSVGGLMDSGQPSNLCNATLLRTYCPKRNSPRARWR